MSIASVAAAQTSADPQVTSETLRQVRGFESALKKAVEQAAQEVGTRARNVVRDVEIRFETQPIATGYVLPTGEGMLFTVEVPGIEATSVMLYLQLAEQQNRQNNPFRGAANPVPAPPPTVAVLTNPEKDYRDFTRQALVDAMLDFAFPLQLKEKQSLTVSAGTIIPGPTNPLAPPAKRLYLTIKAEDLLALRQNTISRDDAKSRIVEKVY